MISLTPLIRLGMCAAGVVAFLVAFFVRDQAIERRGEEKALVKVERATNDAVQKAQAAGAKSRKPNGGGLLNDRYRD